jgi:hypothetical protein
VTAAVGGLSVLTIPTLGCVVGRATVMLLLLLRGSMLRLLLAMMAVVIGLIAMANDGQIAARIELGLRRGFASLKKN